MALTMEIWTDLSVRLNILRGDMVAQWQGDLRNHDVEQAIMSLGSAIQLWDQARPVEPLGAVVQLYTPAELPPP